MSKLKSLVKAVLPPKARHFLRFLRNHKDRVATISFLRDPDLKLSLNDKLHLVEQLHVIISSLESPHTMEEMLAVIGSILSVPKESNGVLVEAGCFKGSSTAKISLAADLMGKELAVFDSFQGIPANDEPHGKNIFGGEANFAKGDYCGTLEEVKANVTKYGKIKSCRFIEGWFDQTMPGFKQPVSVAYIDVDLASSTRTCLKYIYPLLEPGGVLFSQDGHLPLVIDVLNDNNFWTGEVGCKRPEMVGLGKSKLVKIAKNSQ
jgi:O-methyltransferase